MKNRILLLILICLICGCDSVSVNSEIESNEISSNFILDSSFRDYVPILMELRDLTLKNRNNPIPSTPYVYLMVTENYTYVHVSVLDCINSSVYSFQEKIDDNNYQIFVDELSINAERYFDIKNSKLIQINPEPIYL